MKIGPYTVTRGMIVPFDEYSNSEQTRLELSDGAVAISDDWDTEFKKCTIKVSRGEALNIRGFLRRSARYSAEPFEIIDDYGTTWWVRYWDSKINMATAVSNIVEMVMVFRVEVS